MIWDFPYDSPNAISALLEQNGYALSKKFGQNFLLSTAVRRRIADSLGPIDGKRVWEVGPGIGSLTVLLLQAGSRVTAFEIDHGFCRILRQRAFVDETGFTLVEGDVLKTWTDAYEREGTPDVVCGNLPYNIGSVCIARFLERQCLPERMVFTLQKEVARRLASSPGSKMWSTLSILTQIDYDVEQLFYIGKGAFHPAPNVDSTVVGLVRRFAPLVDPDDRRLFLEMVGDLFAQRRKTVKNNLLHGRLGSRFGREAVEQALLASGISGSERAERLGFGELTALADAFPPMP